MIVLPNIFLRPITVGDWPAVHEWASTERACRYQPWGPNAPTETQAFAQDAAAAWRQNPQSRYVWVAEESAATVGLGELKVRSSLQQQGEISYAVHVEHWGRGLGTAIATKLLTFAFGSLGLHRVAGTCDPRNEASAAVLQKVGMTYEGRLRHTTWIRDGWRDSNVYSILSEEWAVIAPNR